jgi:hypothetical protein
VVYQASNAAFTASTSNPTNNWSAGTVAISDNDSDSALFSASGIKPGDTGTRCIVVTYSGSLNATVKLYATSYTDGGLAPYLTFGVYEGTGTQADCSDFSSTATDYSPGTLQDFGVNNASYANGVSGWTPAGGSNATKTYKFSWTLQDDNNANGGTGGALTASTAFTWEAQS